MDVKDDMKLSLRVLIPGIALGTAGILFLLIAVFGL